MRSMPTHVRHRFQSMWVVGKTNWLELNGVFTLLVTFTFFLLDSFFLFIFLLKLVQISDGRFDDRILICCTAIYRYLISF